MPDKFDSQQYLDIFSKVIASQELSKETLNDFAGSMTKNFGIEVSDPALTNEKIFKVAPQVRAHLVAAASGKPHADALFVCPSGGCIACKSGLSVGGAAVIAAAIAGFPEDVPAITAVAEFCGISEEAALAAIQAGITGGFESVVGDLCSAMGAC